MPRFPLGAIRQPFDPRDHQFKVPNRILATLPPWLDLSDQSGPLLDQADEGCCGPHTAVENINYDQKVEGLLVIPQSRNFIYYNTRVLMDTVGFDSGVDNRSMLKSLNRDGSCSEDLHPYNTSTFTNRPSPAAYQAAAANKITDYAAVTQSLADMQGVLVARHPIIFGFSVYNQLMSDEAAATGVVAMPSGNSVGGHDVLLLGFNATGGLLPGVINGNIWPANTFKFRNHWRNGNRWWGDGGYGYIPFAYAVDPNQAWDFWTIQTVPGIVPPPPSPPVPPVPPTPPPVVVGPTYQQTKTLVDAYFADATRQLPRNYRPFMQSFNKALDQALSRLW